MRSFNVLDPMQQVVGPHFLEASAGTGKTFAIEHIVVRLILESTVEIKCHEILVVTFTRAATRELKERIRHSLQRALEHLERRETEIPYLKTLMTDEGARDASIRKLQEVLCSFDQMQIFTIHGFCHQMLKTYAFDAGLGLQDSPLETRSYQEIQKEQIIDFLRTGLKKESFHRHQIHRLLKKVHHDLGKLTQKILSLVNKDAQLPQLLNYEELLALFKAALQKYKVDKNIFIEEFLSMAPLFKGLSSIKKEPHAHFLQQAHLLAECIEDPHQVDLVFDRLLSYDALFLEHLAESALKKNVKIPFQEIQQKSALFALREELYPLLLEATDEKKILLRLASYCRERIQKAFSYHGMTPPDDLLKLMNENLSKRSFCLKVQERYKAAIIDEFQDTDPLQWNIIHELFLLNRSLFPLYLVGDPKQSIYAFRNADLPTYLKAAREFSLDQRYSLSVNYRSEPKLIAALNRLFLMSSQWLSEDETLVYSEVKANPHAVDTPLADEYSPVHFFIAEQESTKERQVPSKQAEEKLFFPFIAQEILKLHGQGKNFGSFAVLIRDRFQGERLESYLKSAQIPCVATSVVNLVDTMAFNFLKTVLHMLGRLEEISEIKRVLAHPFMGFSHEDLKIGLKKGKTLKAISILKTLGALYFEEGFLRFWDAFLQTSFGDSPLSFEKELVRAHIEDYHDLNQLVEILAEEHLFGRLSHEELIYAVARLEEKDPEVDEYIKRRVSFEEAAVTIMTMHKSKGLEFDIVFALGVCVRSSFQEEVIRYKDQLMVLDDTNVIHQEVLKQAEKEKLRQLYVALTRAKTRVYIPLCCHVEPNEKQGLSPIELFLQALFKARGITASSKEEVISALHSFNIEGMSYSDLNKEVFKTDLQRQEEEIFLLPPLAYTKSFVGRYTSSYSKLAQETELFERSTKIIETPLLPACAETGHVLHKILEKIFERGIYVDADKANIHQLIIQETTLSHLSSLEQDIEEMIHRVLQLHFVVDGYRFSFQDISPSQLVTEMEFLLEESSSQTFKGFIDLCFEYQGKYYLVDWKSNFLGSTPEHYSQEALKTCMEEHHYFIQAELYGKAMRAYLNHLGKSREDYGGIFYVFLRGLDGEKGIYFKKAGDETV